MRNLLFVSTLLLLVSACKKGDSDITSTPAVLHSRIKTYRSQFKFSAPTDYQLTYDASDSTRLQSYREVDQNGKVLNSASFSYPANKSYFIVSALYSTDSVIIDAKHRVLAHYTRLRNNSNSWEEYFEYNSDGQVMRTTRKSATDTTVGIANYTWTNGNVDLVDSYGKKILSATYDLDKPSQAADWSSFQDLLNFGGYGRTFVNKNLQIQFPLPSSKLRIEHSFDELERIITLDTYEGTSVFGRNWVTYY
jgi:hypothetical protein